MPDFGRISEFCFPLGIALSDLRRLAALPLTSGHSQYRSALGRATVAAGMALFQAFGQLEGSVLKARSMRNINKLDSGFYHNAMST